MRGHGLKNTARFLVLLCLLGARAVIAQSEQADANGLVTEDDYAAARLQASQDAAILAEAYGLSDQERSALENELLGKVEDEIKLLINIRVAARGVGEAYEAEVARRGPDWIPTEDERERLEAPYRTLADKSPLLFENTQKLVESRLPPDRVAHGRERVASVRETFAERAADENRKRREAEVARAAVVEVALEQHKKADAELSPAGNPMPKQEFVAPTLPAPQIQKPLVAPPPVEKPRPAPRLEPPPPRVEAPATPPQVALPAPRLAPAPPVDEWDRHVDSVAQKYKFTSEQKGRAQAILKDLRDRARQYRKSHTGDYERLKRMSDQTERSAEEKRLNEPLDELFAELKERLEVLPTQEQREAAGGSKSP